MKMRDFKKWAVLVALLVVGLPRLALAQMGSYGCREFIEPPADPELRWLTAALQRSGFQWSEEVHKEYVDYCLRLVAPDLNFSETTWNWLENHPEVFNAAFSVEFPPKPQIIHNFVQMALALADKENKDDENYDSGTSRYGDTQGAEDHFAIVSIDKVEKYKQFLLAYAVRYRNQWLPTTRLTMYRQKGSPYTKAAIERGAAAEGGWYLGKRPNGDFSIKPTDKGSHGQLISDFALIKQEKGNILRKYTGAGDLEQKVTDFLKKNRRMEIFTLTKSPNEFRNKTGIQAKDADIKKINWGRVAHNAHRFPPRVFGNLFYNMAIHVDRYEEGSALGMKLFPLDSAPWPMLLMLTDADPLDESSIIWSLYRQKRNIGRYGYSTYTFSYTKPEVSQRGSKWHPDSAQRILEDGGVCGRQSTMAEFADRSIGTPACGMSQPGHRAFMSYSYNRSTGKYAALLHHSVDTIEVSTPYGWYLPPPIGAVFSDKTKATEFAPVKGGSSINARWHFGLCEAVNRGLSSYEQSRMLMHVLKLYPNANSRQRKALLRSGMKLNIANSDILFTLAQLHSGEAMEIRRLITAFRNAVVKTDAGLTPNQKLKADQDLGRILTDPHVNVKNQSKLTNEWGLFISNELFIGAFSTIPDVTGPEYANAWAGEKIKIIGDYAKAVADELAYQKRINKTGKYTKLIQALFDKYEKTRLSINRVKTTNVREQRANKAAEENAW